MNAGAAAATQTKSSPYDTNDHITSGETLASISGTFIVLACQRFRYRCGRTLSRLLSPKRVVASLLATLFLILYGLSGFLIMSTREPADPQRLRLWLSGGMVLYAIYYAAKCAWSSSDHRLDLSPAETLWIDGGPFRRSITAVYCTTKVIPATFVKSCLLSVVLVVDVTFPVLLVLSIFVSLTQLEIFRMIIARVTSSLSTRERIYFRAIAGGVAGATACQILARVLMNVPMGSAPQEYLFGGFVAIGQTATSDMVHLLSVPWIAAASLAVTPAIDSGTIAYLVVAIFMLPMAIAAFVITDRWGITREHRSELEKLNRGDFHHSDQATGSLDSGKLPIDWFALGRHANLLTWMTPDASPVAQRTAKSVSKYRLTLISSFILPTILCLSPLMSDKINHPWFFIVGGIGMCTSLIAPSALKLDFRRDLSRMVLLRSLPISSWSMVLGQLYFPILITCLFQWTVLAVAALFLNPGWDQVIIWGGMLGALSVFTFAVENALFLAYPHHERHQGVGMVIRTKLTFLGKTCLLLAAFMLLAAWATWCKQSLPPTISRPATMAGALLGTWSLAMAAVGSTIWCWKRFDLASNFGLTNT